MEDLSIWIQIPVAALLVIGGMFSLIGAIGMVRFRDFYMRLHAPTKATTLGIGGVVVASFIFRLGEGNLALHELMLLLFLFLTAPVSANLMAKAGLHLRVKAVAEPPGNLPTK